MKITKTKLAAVSFGAALTSLYAAPELCAQEDTIDATVDLSFDPGTVPFFTGSGIYDYGVLVNVNGIPDTGGVPDPLVVNVGNNGDYGFAVGNTYLGVQFPDAGQLFFELSPGDVFDGRSGDGAPNLSNIGGVSATGVQTIGFISGLGQVGYFRVDLGSGGGPAVFLDGEAAAPDENGMTDFTITIPPLPDGGPEVLLGDVNTDGVVDFLDISPFIVVLSGGGFQEEADIDQNGVVDFLDISPFIQILSGASSLQVSWSDSSGKPLERFAAGNEVLEQQIEAVELKLQQEFNTALAQANSSNVDSKSSSLGLAALAVGAAGLRRRRKAATVA